MTTFEITYVENWIPVSKGFFQAENHKKAMLQLDNSAKRIYNNRFREIEMTGKYYLVKAFAGRTFVFECIQEITHD